MNMQEKDDWMIIVVLFNFLRECACTREYIQKENKKKRGGGNKRKKCVKDKGSCSVVVLLCTTGKSRQQEKGYFVFLFLEEIITALNVCRQSRNRARLAFRGC